MVLPPRDFESRASTNSAIPAVLPLPCRECGRAPKGERVVRNYSRPRTYNRRVRLSDFDYDLPPELVAQHPATERTASRLLHVDNASGAIEDLSFPDIVSLLNAGDLLVVNDTRVISARLHARKGPGGEP